MVWVYIALSMIGLIGLAAFLLRFRFSLDLQLPGNIDAGFNLAFLWYRKEYRLARSSPGKAEKEESPVAAVSPFPLDAQSGFLRVRLPKALRRWKARFRKASRKWVLDIRVWRTLAGYALHTLGRCFRLLHPTLDFLRVATGNITALGRFAAVWSMLAGMFPALACPVEYGFNQKPLDVRMRMSGGFTGLGVLFLALVSIFTFPWYTLVSRFVHCWRFPRLSRWQRRLLLL